MALLALTLAPHPIFKQRSNVVDKVDVTVQRFIDDLFHTLEVEQAVGMAAPMVGVLKRIAIVDLHEGGQSRPLTLINPEITSRSETMQEHEEASLCFPSISAVIRRPYAVTVRYLDYNGVSQEMQAEGFLASVIQHELDYLDGVTYLDHLSRLKRDGLMKKMQKYLRENPPHVHGAGCSHHHH
jgi:peptide deformylase